MGSKHSHGTLIQQTETNGVRYVHPTIEAFLKVLGWISALNLTQNGIFFIKTFDKAVNYFSKIAVMRLRRYVWIAGFAIFSMFFGAGNLVFPLSIGQQTIQHSTAGILGLLITGVLVPFIGLVGMMLFQCNRKHFFQALGAKASACLGMVIIGLMGPFGAGPRCINVAFGSFEVIWPNLSPVFFNAAFCLIIGWVIKNQEKVVGIIGGWLSPLLLASILLILCVGFFNAPEFRPISNKTTYESFQFGLLEGYQTMDLLASFFFSTTAYLYLSSQPPGKTHKKAGRALLKEGVYASLIGAVTLAVIYLGLVKLGAYYAQSLQGVEGERMLMVVSEKALGHFAAPILALLFNLACLTTATAVVHLFSNFLREDICKNQISERISLWTSIGTTYIVSLLGFSTICRLLNGVVSLLYPALIVFSLCNLLSRFVRFEKAAWGFYGMLGWVIMNKYLL